VRSGMKMLALNALRENARSGRDSQQVGMTYDTTRNEYNGSGMNYGGVEGRFRGNGGYSADNERLSPRDNYEPESRRDSRGRYARSAAESNSEQGEMHYPRPVYEEMRGRSEERYKPMNRIGFSISDESQERPREFAQEYQMMAGYDEKGRRGEKTGGHATATSLPSFDREMADEWTAGMENTDDSTGPHWDRAEARRLMMQHNIRCDEDTFYAVLNSVYSDYAKVAKKYGIGERTDFYADMAKAWIEDKDAVKEKAAAYFTYVVKH